MRQRGARAVTALHALEERQPGTPRVPADPAADPAAAALMAHQRVAGRGHVPVTPDVPPQGNRRDGTRPAPPGRRARVRVGAARAAAPLTQAVQRLGGRVEATPHTAQALALAQGMAA